jgi:hypothetical protein
MLYKRTLTEMRREMARIIAELSQCPVTTDRERDIIIEYSLQEAG